MFIKKLVVLCGIIVLFFLTACVPTVNLSKLTLLRSPESFSHEYPYEKIRETDYAVFKEKMNVFASKLGDEITNNLYQEGKNVTCAPISIELCLGLAISAANNETRAELLDAIGIDYDTFAKYYKVYYDELYLNDVNEFNQVEAKLLLSNSIWIDNDVTLYDKGLDDLQNNYYCYAYEADFNGNNKVTNKAIREFIKQQTNGLIDPEMNLSTDIMFVLMNTIYLKDIWNDLGRDLKFADGSYKFTNINGNVSDKQLLDGYYNVGKTMHNDNYSAFYTQTYHHFNVFFVMPETGVDIKDIITSEMISYVTNIKNYVTKDDEKMEEYYTKCIFPEFKASCDIDIMEILEEKFGIRKMFTNGQCDFTNLTDNKYGCTGVKHIAKIEVNKKGIEGAAVTYIPTAGAAGPGPYTKVYEEYVVNKEFAFIVTYADIILFTGVVTNID